MQKVKLFTRTPAADVPRSRREPLADHPLDPLQIERRCPAAVHYNFVAKGVADLGRAYPCSFHLSYMHEHVAACFRAVAWRYVAPATVLVPDLQSSIRHDGFLQTSPSAKAATNATAAVVKSQAAINPETWR
jgi:hypothetical protein